MNPKSQEGSSVPVRRSGRAVLLSCLTFICVILAAAVALSGVSICYAVVYEGAVVGTLSDKEALAAAVEEADERAEDLLGEEHPIVTAVTVEMRVGGQDTSPEELTCKLLEGVDGIAQLYAVRVDGVTVAALEDEEALGPILSAFMDRYTNENTISVRFTQEIATQLTYVGEALLCSPDELFELLDPENADSPCGLTVVTQELTQKDEAVPYETRIEYDEAGYSDEIALLCEGQDGEARVTFLTQTVNGEAVSTVPTQTRILVEPVEEVVSVGALPGSRTDSRGFYIWPTEGVVSSGYGSRTVDIGSSNHKGLDIANDVGTAVFAADGGTVIYAQYSSSGYGNLIKIQHDDGSVTYYGHLSKILVSVGDKVAQGDLIGKMGKTGNVSGPHLHFEVRPDGETPVNPLKYLEKR